MRVGKIFKRIALFIVFVAVFFVTLFIVFISFIRLDCRKRLDVPISKEERRIFNEIQAEIGFVADTTNSRYIYVEECYRYEFVYSIEFRNERGEEYTDSIFKKQSLKFYNWLRQDDTFSSLINGRDIAIYIEYEENDFYIIKMLKDKHFLHHWSERDSIILK